ncbi:MAG: PIG-L family deacetylase [Firmicutes bacterium]|nr:PIG-L family deacetylase [Bacillota bacterium]
MLVKLAKVFGVLFLILVLMLGILYILAPYLIKSRMARSEVKAEPGKYEGLNALPENGKVLFVTAHPDDLEFMAGGTIPKLLERGNDVYLAILTNGGKQSYMPAFYSKRIIKTRHDEQLIIARAEGLKHVFFFNYADGSLRYSDEALKKVEKIAKQVDVDCIFTFAPGSPDAWSGLRRAVSRNNKVYGGDGQAVQAGLEMDGDHSAAGQIGTEVAKRNSSIKSLYYFRAANPNLIVDTSDTFDKKIDLLFMFTEFKYKKRMMRAMHEAWDGMTGKRIGVKYAEAFRKVNPREAKPEVKGTGAAREITR